MVAPCSLNWGQICSVAFICAILYVYFDFHMRASSCEHFPWRGPTQASYESRLQESFVLSFHPLSSPTSKSLLADFHQVSAHSTLIVFYNQIVVLAPAIAKMSRVRYQLMSGQARIPTPQGMGPINGWFDEYPIEEDLLQSTTFNTTYSGNWHANMQFSGQTDPTSVNYSRSNPPNIQPPGQFTETFVDESLNIPTHTQPAGQFTLTSFDQSRNAPTNIQDIGQFTTSPTNQSRNVSTNIQPLGQHTQAPIKHGGSTTTNVPADRQATQPTIHYRDNSTTSIPPNNQPAEASSHYSGSPRTSIPLDGQANPALVRYGGNGNKNRQTTGKSPPASNQGRKKHPAVVEDKNIERCAGEYNISYDEVTILKDYANARLKGIETSEPKDAPSRYVISRFEEVRRTYPEHATWPYDIPEEKIIRLLPGQKRQDRAPVKCFHGACEKRRQELDARYHESRQWEGPPPLRTDQKHQDSLTAPSSDDIATGLTPPPWWNSNPTEAAETSTVMQHDSMDPSDKITPAAASYGFQMDGIEGGFQPPPPPPPPPTNTPSQPDSVNTGNYLVDGRAASDDMHMAGSEEPVQFPLPQPTFTPRKQGSEDPLDDSNLPAISDDSQYDYLFEEPDQPPTPLPTPKPTEQDNINPVANSDLPAVSDDSQYDYLFEEPVQPIDDSELDECCDEPAQRPSPLPTFTPAKQISINPLNNSTLPAVSNDSEYDDLFEQPLQPIDDSELDEYFDEPAQPPPVGN